MVVVVGSWGLMETLVSKLVANQSKDVIVATQGFNRLKHLRLESHGLPCLAGQQPPISNKFFVGLFYEILPHVLAEIFIMEDGNLCQKNQQIPCFSGFSDPQNLQAAEICPEADREELEGHAQVRQDHVRMNGCKEHCQSPSKWLSRHLTYLMFWHGWVAQLIPKQRT